MDYTKIKDAAIKIVANIKAMENDITALKNKHDIISTSDTAMIESYSGRVLIDEIGGKCEQFSTTGNQLFDVNDGVLVHKPTTIDSDGWITMTLDNSTLTNTGYATFYTNVSDKLKPSTPYTIVVEIKSITAGTKLYSVSNNESSHPSQFANSFTHTSAGTYIKSIITKDSFDTSQNMCRSFLEVPVGISASITFRLSVLEDTTVTEDTFVYEPYTNGASPNPDYPQEINRARGKNLLDCRGLTTQTKDGVTFTPAYDGNGNLKYVEANGTATANAYYYIKGAHEHLVDGYTYISTGCPNSGSSTTYRCQIEPVVNDVKQYMAFYDEKGVTYQVTEKPTSMDFVICVFKDYTATNLRFYPMIRKASVEDSTYVPYGLLRVKTRGKNLFNGGQNRGQYASGIWYYQNDRISTEMIQICSSDMTFSFQSEDDRLSVLNVHYFDENKKWLGDITTLGIPSLNYVCRNLTLALPKEAKYVVMTACGYSDKALDISTYFLTNDMLQIEEGTVATDYEPYTESSVTLSQPIELYGIGDVQDTIEDGKVVRRFGEIVFNGQESFTLQTNTPPGGYYFLYDNNSVKKSTNNGVKPNWFCNRLPITTPNGIYGTNKDGISTSDTGYRVRFRVASVSSIVSVGSLQARLKEWYDAGNPMTVVYELATETTEDLPIVDQIALNSLKSFNGTTYIEFDAEVQPTFKGEYGTSKVGGYTLEGMLAGINGELYGKNYADRITALEATVVNNI